MKKWFFSIILCMTIVRIIYGESAGDAYYNRGLDKYLQGDHQGAIEDYTKAIETNPSYALAYINRGKAKNDIGDIQGAIDDYTKAIELDPSNFEPYGYRGISKVRLGDNTGAIEDYTKAIELDPDNLYVYTNRGIAKLGLNDYASAIDDYSKAIEIDPNDGLIFYNRGIAKHIIGDINGACQDWHKSQILRHEGAEYFIKIYCELFDCKEAMVIVNDTEISGEMFNRRLNSIITQYPPNQHQQLYPMLRKEAIDSLINEFVVIEEARRQSIAPKDKEIDITINAIVSQYSSVSAFEKELKESGQTMDSLREVIREDLMKAELISRNIPSDLKATDEDIAKFYCENSSKYEGISLEDVSGQIGRDLTNQKQLLKMNEYIMRLREKARIEYSQIFSDRKSGAE